MYYCDVLLDRYTPFIPTGFAQQMSTQGAGPRIEPVAHLAADRRTNNVVTPHPNLPMSLCNIFCPLIGRPINGIIVKHSAFPIHQILLDHENISSEDS
jgi:hypothetical protein